MEQLEQLVRRDYKVYKAQQVLMEQLEQLARRDYKDYKAPQV